MFSISSSFMVNDYKGMALDERISFLSFVGQIGLIASGSDQDAPILKERKSSGHFFKVKVY